MVACLLRLGYEGEHSSEFVKEGGRGKEEGERERDKGVGEGEGDGDGEE